MSFKGESPDYTMCTHKGIMVHDSKDPACPKCFYSPIPRVVPLKVIKDTLLGWHCTVCNGKFENPDYTVSNHTIPDLKIT